MKNRTVLVAFVGSLLLGLSPLAADLTITRGIDVFVTPADGRTSYDFAKNPIPAGFFCKGSKPFTGRVAFKGLPLATKVPGQLANADTVVERLDDAAFDARGTATTRVQFRALSLVSIAPVRTGCGAYHAYVSLGGEQRVTTMNIHRTQEDGGTFVAPLAVDVRLTFVPVKPARGKAARKLELPGSFTFPAKPLPWSLTDRVTEKKASDIVVDTDGDLFPDTQLSGASNFVAGVSPGLVTRNKIEGNCCSEYVCHYTDPSTGKVHCAWVVPPGCQDRPYEFCAM